jgi:hypothetical protein
MVSEFVWFLVVDVDVAAADVVVVVVDDLLHGHMGHCYTPKTDCITLLSLAFQTPRSYRKGGRCRQRGQNSRRVSCCQQPSEPEL